MDLGEGEDLNTSTGSAVEVPDRQLSVKEIYALGISPKRKMDLLLQYKHITQGEGQTSVHRVSPFFNSKVTVDGSILTVLGVDYNIHKIPGDGNCMYHAVLQASRAKGLPPGIHMKDPSELRKKLRRAIYQGRGNGIEEWWDIFHAQSDILERIQEGIDKANVPSSAWGGGPEITLIETVYSIRIKIISEDGVQFGRNFRNQNDVIVLYYVGNNHYNWLEETQHQWHAE